MRVFHHRPLSSLEEARIVRLIRSGEHTLNRIAKITNRTLYRVKQVEARLAESVLPLEKKTLER